MDRDAECKEAIETSGAHSVDRRPPLPDGWGPTIRSSASSRSLVRPPSNNQASIRSLPEGWVNTDTIRSIIQLGGQDTVKSILSLPRGEDGFIHRQASIVDLDPEHKIGQWPSTAIAGNDILSSCLYAIGLVTQRAGCLAPLAFLTVSLVLYLYRGIYAMGVLTFPYNGGSYNLLANVSPKLVATFGGCLSIVAYIATCVVSGVSACFYLGEIMALQPSYAACVLLCAFALLVLTGLKESTRVALTIFMLHALTLTMLAAGAIAMAVADGFKIFRQNLQDPIPGKDDGNGIEVIGNFVQAVFFGFSTAMLGVSGFESSAQFVESMKPGVFVQTLRNLWGSVTVVNPLLSFLSLAILPMNEIDQNRDTVLAHMARSVGRWIFGDGSVMVKVLVSWMSFDAFIVLSGAVLTAFVGVDGLIYQLAVDNCMPTFLMRKNRWRRTNHWIIIIFLVLCVALVLIMNGAVDSLAGVYSIAFLSVMACFGIGAALLKRSPLYAPTLITDKLMLNWPHLIIAIGMVLLGLVGNLVMSTSALASFVAYMTPCYAICVVCIFWKHIKGAYLRATGKDKADEPAATVSEAKVVPPVDLEAAQDGNDTLTPGVEMKNAP